jgi:uncharacterized protein YidB (DUF937 family)
MGLFDDAVPGGSIAKPMMIALGALLVGKMMGGSGQSAPPSPTASPAQPDVGGLGGLGGLLQGGMAGGLGSLLERLASAGQGDVANSWVGTGTNQPIQPHQLGTALGQTTVSDLARQTGMSEEELMAQLARVLPGVVDKLTPGGRIPNQTEIAPHFNI